MQLAVQILVPQLGVEPGAPAVDVQSSNHWTAREFYTLKKNFCSLHRVSEGKKVGVPVSFTILAKLLGRD